MFGLFVTFAAIIGSMALDLAQWNNDRTLLQGAADTAALAAVQEFDKGNWSAESIRRVAGLYVSRNINGLSTVKLESVNLDAAARKATVSLSMPARRSLVPLYAPDAHTVKVSAMAVRQAGSLNKANLCLLALEPQAKDALLGLGGTQLTGINCGAHVNSTSASATTLSGGSRLTTTSNCLVGGVSQGLAAITAAPDFTCKALPDPFAQIALPDLTGPCNQTNLTLTADTTLSPGIYCGTLTLQNKTFTFNPGFYVIRGGVFSSTGGAVLKGDGVTFLLTGTGAGLNWSGGGTYRLTAMKSGPLAGFLAYLDPKAAAAAGSTVSGGGNAYFEGAIYLPTQRVTLSGGTGATVISPFTAMIGRSFTVTGGGTVTLSLDLGKTGVPVPKGLLTVAASTRLLR